jgi:hypothetical protein
VYTALPYNKEMFTVIETHVFKRSADGVWSEDERQAFIEWLAGNPLAGDVVPGADGLRKVRWARAGMGKRGGAESFTTTCWTMD